MQKKYYVSGELMFSRDVLDDIQVFKSIKAMAKRQLCLSDIDFWFEPGCTLEDTNHREIEKYEAGDMNYRMEAIADMMPVRTIIRLVTGTDTVSLRCDTLSNADRDLPNIISKMLGAMGKYYVSGKIECIDLTEKEYIVYDKRFYEHVNAVHIYSIEKVNA